MREAAEFPFPDTHDLLKMSRLTKASERRKDGGCGEIVGGWFEVESGREESGVEEGVSEAYLRKISGENDLTVLRSLALTVDTNVSQVDHLGILMPCLAELRLGRGSTLASFRDLGSSLKNLRVLWVSACGIRHLDGVGALSGLEELYVAFNDVEDLTSIALHEQLEVLDLESNNVGDADQAMQLGTCPRLWSLTLAANPITRIDFYRRTVVEAIPTLNSLDEQDVTDVDRCPLPLYTEEHTWLEASFSHRPPLDNSRLLQKSPDRHTSKVEKARAPLAVDSAYFNACALAIFNQSNGNSCRETDTLQARNGVEARVDVMSCPKQRDVKLDGVSEWLQLAAANTSASDSACSTSTEWGKHGWNNPRFEVSTDRQDDSRSTGDITSENIKILREDVMVVDEEEVVAQAIKRLRCMSLSEKDGRNQNRPGQDNKSYPFDGRDGVAHGELSRNKQRCPYSCRDSAEVCRDNSAALQYTSDQKVTTSPQKRGRRADDDCWTEEHNREGPMGRESEERARAANDLLMEVLKLQDITSPTGHGGDTCSGRTNAGSVLTHGSEVSIAGNPVVGLRRRRTPQKKSPSTATASCQTTLRLTEETTRTADPRSTSDPISGNPEAFIGKSSTLGQENGVVALRSTRRRRPATTDGNFCCKFSCGTSEVRASMCGASKRSELTCYSTTTASTASRKVRSAGSVVSDDTADVGVLSQPRSRTLEPLDHSSSRVDERRRESCAQTMSRSTTMSTESPSDDIRPRPRREILRVSICDGSHDGITRGVRNPERTLREDEKYRNRKESRERGPEWSPTDASYRSSDEPLLSPHRRDLSFDCRRSEEAIRGLRADGGTTQRNPGSNELDEVWEKVLPLSLCGAEHLWERNKAPGLGCEGGSGREPNTGRQAFGAAVSEEDRTLVELLRKRPKHVPQLRTRQAFRQYFRGMDPARLASLLRAAYSDCASKECDAKVKRRLMLMEKSFVGCST